MVTVGVGIPAASASYCYLVDDNGVTHDLGTLCGGISTPVIALPSPPPLEAAPVISTDYRAVLRSQGLSPFSNGNYTGRDRIDLAYEV